MLARLYVVPAGAEHHPRLASIVVSSSAANANVWGTWTNDQPLPLLLNAVGGVMSPGAAQYLMNWHFELQHIADQATSAVLFGEHHDSTVAAIARYVGHTLPSPILVPPRYSVSINGRFNAGANSNSIDMLIWGAFIPRGNIAYP